MESNSIIAPIAETPRVAADGGTSATTAPVRSKSRAAKATRPPRSATAAPAGEPEQTARLVRKALRRRFGRKSFDPGRIALRYPLHEAIAGRSLDRFVTDETTDAATEARVAVNGHSRDRTAALVETSALLEGLRRNGGGLSEEQLAPLWTEAWRDTDELARASSADESPLARILAAEVLFASSIVFDEAPDMRARRKSARGLLVAELEARTDTDGTPHASLLNVLPAWFASLTRCAHWARSADVRLWNAEYAGRFDGLLRAVATMTAGGSLALGGGSDIRPMLSDALKYSGWKNGSPVGRLVKRIASAGDDDGVPRRESSPHKIDRASPPASQSDWAKLLVSRTRWSADADSLVIAHHSAIPSIEFAAFGRRFFSGTWDFRVRIDDADVALAAECDVVCWFSDADAEYVELQWTTEPGLVICRQAMLTRGDHQLLLADSVAAPARPAARVEIEAALPLVQGTSGELLRPGREVRLNADKVPVRCFPIALPMDRILRSTGSLEPENDRLIVRQAGLGAAYSPVLFDWHPRRRELPADWRLLTVTEDGRRLSAEAAVGCRIRLGKRQLLVYRNLNGSKAKRAVLGHHHDHETVIGRFTSDGEVDPLVLVE